MEAGIVDPQSDRAGRRMRRAKMRMETIKDVLLMPCVLTLRNNACATRLEWEGRFSNICLKAVDFEGLEGGKNREKFSLLGISKTGKMFEKPGKYPPKTGKK